MCRGLENTIYLGSVNYAWAPRTAAHRTVSG
jgi:hypothetical protein